MNEPKTKINLPSIKDLSKNLEKTVYELCLPGGRMVGTPGHEVAKSYLRRALSQTGCIPYQGDSFDLPYSCLGEDFINLVGVIPGANRDLPPILIGAHYDSVIPDPCADDNGAAVAIALAVAAAAKNSPQMERDLIVAIFDAEEPPYFLSSAMGSTRFYEDQVDARGIHFAIIHDLVGHDISVPVNFLPVIGKVKAISDKDLAIPFLKNALFVTGAESNPGLSSIIEACRVDKLKVAATLNKYIGDMSDHGVFRRKGVPYLFFSCGRWAHYHSPTDTPDRLNYVKMAAITELSARILRQIAAENLPENSQEDHSLEYEIRSLQKLFGPFFPILLGRLEIKKLESREDLEKFISLMLNASGL